MPHTCMRLCAHCTGARTANGAHEGNRSLFMLGLGWQIRAAQWRAELKASRCNLGSFSAAQQSSQPFLRLYLCNVYPSPGGNLIPRQIKFTGKSLLAVYSKTSTALTSGLLPYSPWCNVGQRFSWFNNLVCSAGTFQCRYRIKSLWFFCFVFVLFFQIRVHTKNKRPHRRGYFNLSDKA